MAEEILNGADGPKISAKVDGNHQLHTYTVSETVINSATSNGDSYNINTGWIGLTSASASAVFYFKNNEAPVNGVSDLVIDTIIIGIDDEGTTAGMSTIEIIRNPTAGTIVTNAVAVSANANKNFSSSNSLDSIVYKGVEGDTLTDGTSFGILGQQPGTRVGYPVDIELGKGSSIGIKIDSDTSSGTTNVYVAIICHRKNGKNL